MPKGTTAVFPYHPSGLFISLTEISNRRLIHLSQDVSAAALLNSDDYPSTLILANANGLAIGRVKDLDKLHIQSVGACSVLLHLDIDAGCCRYLLVLTIL